MWRWIGVCMRALYGAKFPFVIISLGMCVCVCFGVFLHWACCGFPYDCYNVPYALQLSENAATHGHFDVLVPRRCAWKQHFGCEHTRSQKRLLVKPNGYVLERDIKTEIANIALKTQLLTRRTNNAWATEVEAVMFHSHMAHSWIFMRLFSALVTL